VNAQREAGQDVCCDWQRDEEGLEGERLVVRACEEEVGF
jgi:hypothetical protein